MRGGEFFCAGHQQTVAMLDGSTAITTHRLTGGQAVAVLDRSANGCAACRTRVAELFALTLEGLELLFGFSVKDEPLDEETLARLAAPTAADEP